ncbi:hypothetical protein DPEC_G00094910 [Dallia pectoralis]|uniref:Uncharacterized protein n=1 Tax=Dallia pectoralis TaxID=75939 RepID=A0ACC2GW32_DALPE|nr:hypothetical protein DPEC_G00094910 [Dallia pectoralis]
MNWKGVNGKRSFNQMESKVLLIRAVRKCAISGTATDTEISQHAIRWFNLATDRGGGRKERSKQAEEETTEYRRAL